MARPKQAKKRGPGRPKGTTKKNPEDRIVRLPLSKEQHSYLTWLTRHSKWGATIEAILLGWLDLGARLEKMDPSETRRSQRKD